VSVDKHSELTAPELSDSGRFVFRSPSLPGALRLIRSFPNLGLFLSTVIFIVVTAILEPTFASTINLRDVARDWGILMAASLGQMLVILIGGIDLSVSANIAFVSVAATQVANHSGTGVGQLVGLLIGIGIGTVNGLLISVLKIDAVIATVGTLQIFTGAAFLWSNGSPLQANPLSFLNLGTSTAFGVCYATFIGVGLIVVGYLLLKRTVYGRYVYAIGGSEDAARAAGINVGRYKAAAFVISGLLSGVAGILLASRVGGASATLGSDILINSVAAVFIGGVAFGGGVGGIAGVAVGALLITAVTNGLEFYGISSFVEEIVTGVILIVSLYVTRLRKART